MLECRQYAKLPREAAMIRQEVFVEEQGFELEFDEIDPIAQHIVLFENGAPIAPAAFIGAAAKIPMCWAG